MQFDYPLTHARPLLVIPRTNHPDRPTTIHNVHDGLEIGIMLSGREERLFSEVTLPVNTGDVWLAARWEMHGVRAFGPCRNRVITIVFLPEFLGESTLAGTPWLYAFAVPPSQRPRVRSGAVRKRVLEIGEAIWEEESRRALSWQEEVRLDLLRLLLALRRDWEPPQHIPELPEDRGNKLQQVLPALSLVYTDPCGRLSVARAAAECSLSPNYFNSLFQEAMGTSFAKFCLRGRVNEACRLLTATDQRIDAVAERAGFANASHLHHTFLKHCACTPAEYRRRFGAAAATTNEAEVSRA